MRHVDLHCHRKLQLTLQMRKPRVMSVNLALHVAQKQLTKQLVCTKVNNTCDIYVIRNYLSSFEFGRVCNRWARIQSSPREMIRIWTRVLCVSGLSLCQIPTIFPGDVLKIGLDDNTSVQIPTSPLDMIGIQCEHT